jgi:hypothetical protein
MRFEEHMDFMKSRNQHTKRTPVLDVIVVVAVWLIALALVYSVIIKLRLK